MWASRISRTSGERREEEGQSVKGDKTGSQGGENMYRLQEAHGEWGMRLR